MQYARGDVIDNRYRIERFLRRDELTMLYEVMDHALVVKFALELQIADREQCADDTKWLLNAIAVGTRLNDAAKNDVGRRGSDLLLPYRHGVTATGAIYQIFPLVSGVTLGEYLEHHMDRNNAADVYKFAEQLFSALAFVHECGLVHRHVSQNSILLTPDRAELSNFRFACAIGDPFPPGELSFFVGNAAYATREQLLGHAPTASMDIFSAGIAVYQMLTGQYPWGHLDTDYARAILSDDPPNARRLSDIGDFPPEVADAVARCLSHDPHERPSALWLTEFFGRLARDARPRQEERAH